ncbi:hypothetical protein SLS56_011406 [Neofusicoccum ribis]|uniref:Zn(2)-C6 fungal-type domain-containing protein n=1 Tax=Neofusicoccum ribis TaxID=45134 RepID=A0ABR3SBR3_9PEZI
MRILVVTTVTPDGEVHELAEDCVESFQALEAFVRDAYSKESRDYDFHIHYNRVCNGRNQVTPHTYASLVSSNTLFGKSAESRQCYVCLVPKAALSPGRSPYSPVSEPENPPALTGSATQCSTKSQAQAPDSTENPSQQKYSEANASLHSEESPKNVDEQPATQDRWGSVPTPRGRAYELRTSHELQNSLPVRSATKRPGGEYPKDEASVKRRRQGPTDQLKSSTTVIVGAPDQGPPALPPLTSQNLAAATKHILTHPLLGSPDAPWSISSRDLSSATSSRTPSSLEPESSHQITMKSEQPTHSENSEKTMYEFLLSKRLPKRKFMVGTIRPSSFPVNFEPSSDGRVNAVGVQLQRIIHPNLSTGIVNRVIHYTLSQDPTGRPLKNLPRPRTEITCVDYFPELQALYDLRTMTNFLVKYSEALSEGRAFESSFAKSQYEEGEDGEEGEEDEEGEGEESAGHPVASLTPPSKVIKLRLPRDFLGHLRGSHFAETNVSADPETTTNSGEKLNQSSDKQDRCSKCRIDDRKCTISGLKNNTSCQRCIVLALVCSLSEKAVRVLPGFPHQTRFGAGGRDLGANEQQEKGDYVLEETQGQPPTDLRRTLFPEDEGDVASAQPSDGISSGDSRPQHLDANADYALEKSNAAEILSHGGTYEPPGMGRNDQEKTLEGMAEKAKGHQRHIRKSYDMPTDVNVEQEDMPTDMMRPRGGHVKLNITFTDHVAVRDGSRPYDFKRNHFSVSPKLQKPSELLTVLREIIEEEGINTPRRVLTEDHATELEQADLSVAISAVHTDSGTHSMGRKPRPWFNSWDLSANLALDNFLMTYAHDTVDLSVEMWGKSKHGVNNPSALHKR